MKSIKQIREEYDNKILDQMPQASDDLVLEGRESKSLKSLRTVPSPSEMPAMLLFRRMAYRLYPNKQVVALYYSKAVDKYLSIPFGPDGNLNLSESTVYNTYEDMIVSEGAKWDIAKGALKGAAHGAIRGGAIGGAIAPGPGTVIGAGIGAVRGAIKGAKSVSDKNVTESFKSKISAMRKERVDEGITDAITGAISGARIGGLPGAVIGGIMGMKSGKSKTSSKVNTSTDQSVSSSTHGALLRSKTAPKTSSSWAQTKQKEVVNENKISDIRKMINEESKIMNMEINGRSVTLNTTMAKRILEVYDSVNTKNKKIVESMLNEDLESFKKLLNFSIKA